MKTPIDPHAPAFPLNEFFEDGSHNGCYPGLTIRAEIASRIMAGLAACSIAAGSDDQLADAAVNAADALISRLNREEKP